MLGRIRSPFRAEELSSRIYIMAAPQQMATPVMASIGTRVLSYPEGPLLGSGMGCNGGSLVGVSINSN
jgi:hypothetical protein